jgi:hypothetical protein
MTATVPDILVSEAGEDREVFLQLRSTVHDAYARRDDHDDLVIEEYTIELWRRLHRINVAEREMIRRALLRARRAHGRRQAAQVQDHIAHNPAALLQTVGGLRYLLDELDQVTAAVGILAPDAPVMQPVKQLSARLQDAVPPLVTLSKRDLTTPAKVTAAVQALQMELRQGLVEEEKAELKLEAIETVICRLPAGPKGELLLRYLRQSDRRLSALRRYLEPIRCVRPIAEDAATHPGSQEPTA